MVIAVQSILCGVLEIATAIRQWKAMEGEKWLILQGALAVLFGAVLLMTPVLSSLILIRILGAFAILFGIMVVTTSFRLRRLGIELDQP